MIPARDPATGCIPPGRYATDLYELRREFVEPYTSTPPSRREELWAKFERYLIAWDEAQVALGVNLLLAIWISGSFITSKDEPDDIDVTVIYDGVGMSDMSGKPGARDLKKACRAARPRQDNLNSRRSSVSDPVAISGVIPASREALVARHSVLREARGIR